MENSVWDRESSPYHEGEIELHRRLGRAEQQTRMGRQVHRPSMPEQHRDFFKQLPFLLLGSVDIKGRPWASIVFGELGFAVSPDDKTLTVNAAVIPGDPLADNLKIGAPLGVLGLEMPTRRRNRMNGVIKSKGDKSFQISVVQSYGNCPQYIQTRDMDFVQDPALSAVPEMSLFTELDEFAVNLIASADTFFVASFNHRDDKLDTGGADISHRGGRPGFIKIEGNTLTIPDYMGNFAFNTLGNFHVYPKAGLLFVDFESGDLCQLTGSVELMWDKTDEIEAFRGAERAWRFHMEQGVRLKNAAPLRWQFREASPNNALTGDWLEAAKAQSAEEKRNTWRSFRIVRIEEESVQIRSYYLEPADGSGLAVYLPGQFLTVRVASDKFPEGITEQVRTYTLSSAPADNLYRISIKREQRGDPFTSAYPHSVSNFFHDQIVLGDVIEVLSPRGEFTLNTSEPRPVVLFAGGVGVTPMISMTRQALSDSLRLRVLRSITVFHAVQSTEQRAFLAEFSDLQKASDGLLRYISVVTSPRSDEVRGRDFHLSGRLTQSMVQMTLPLADYDCYLCGPSAFMQFVYDLLIELGVSDQRIFAESFGPASLQRVKQSGFDNGDSPANVASEAVVNFQKTGFEQIWTSDSGTLLEFAEAHGVSPEFGCRSGACGSCAVRKVSGEAAYVTKPKIQPADGEVLICCAVPAKSDEPLVLEL